ncbi:Lipid-binding SYLF domain-containing protein [Ralstonia sp. 25mfcol4.1]|uniref:BPSL1445 family SYLF domain-containing lipoprotein n=1 Tax=Burkholderiaceae TaxID=119060 RepID=UPI0008834D7A|nr:YSC84-related protein [Ralstonia sp. 25mfcol4.1]SDP34018.1 Lipid-binding SYLF domain-containing protein [Ralstonia sp. 25mfcol4.1]
MNRRLFMSLPSLALAPALFACTTNMSGSDAVAKRREIDAGVDGTMSKLFASASSAQALSQQAKGILVFPKILAAGFIVGAEYGEGSLRVANAPVGYYRTTTASFGFLAGAQSKALILMFMTDAALQAFQASSGWTAGVDGSVALATIGANGQIDTNTARAPIVGFVLTNAGLMANLSLEGTKISKLDI